MEKWTEPATNYFCSTWEGPAWSPAQQLSGLLISIQSIMNDKPYFNEPGCSRVIKDAIWTCYMVISWWRDVLICVLQEAYPGDVKRYNDFVRYQTLRVAVCGMMKNECHLNIPQQLQDIMEQTFFQYFDQYMDVAKQNMNLDGTQLVVSIKFLQIWLFIRRTVWSSIFHLFLSTNYKIIVLGHLHLRF